MWITASDSNRMICGVQPLAVLFKMKITWQFGWVGDLLCKWRLSWSSAGRLCNVVIPIRKSGVLIIVMQGEGIHWMLQKLSEGCSTMLTWVPSMILMVLLESMLMMTSTSMIVSWSMMMNGMQWCRVTRGESSYLVSDYSTEGRQGIGGSEATPNANRRWRR